MGRISEIKTGIDRFLELINASGETKIEAAAENLGIPAETIEIWAEILQQDGVIEIGYDNFGKMTVRPKQPEIPNAPAKESKQPLTKKEAQAYSPPILKKIREKPAWKKRRESKARKIYRARLQSRASPDKAPAKESALSRLLKRLGMVH